jgi:hypothetical protein
MWKVGRRLRHQSISVSYMVVRWSNADNRTWHMHTCYYCCVQYDQVICPLASCPFFLWFQSVVLHLPRVEHIIIIRKSFVFCYTTKRVSQFASIYNIFLSTTVVHSSSHSQVITTVLLSFHTTLISQYYEQWRKAMQRNFQSCSKT